MSMRIAVLGLGFMGSTHVKAWKNIREAELAAVYSKRRKETYGRPQRYRGKPRGPAGTFDFRNVRKYRDIPELLNDPGYRRRRYLPPHASALCNRFGSAAGW